jgi:hypothetical protein
MFHDWKGLLQSPSSWLSQIDDGLGNKPFRPLGQKNHYWLNFWWSKLRFYFYYNFFLKGELDIFVQPYPNPNWSTNFFIMIFSKEMRIIFVKVSTKCVRPWGQKRPWLVGFSYLIFPHFLIHIFLKGDSKFVSLWPRKVLIGQENELITCFILKYLRIEIRACMFFFWKKT